MILLRIFAALTAAGCCCVLAYRAASRLLPGTRISARLAGALCLGYWLLAWVFALLGLVGWFRLGVIVPICIGLPLVYLWHRRRNLGQWLAEARAELFDEAHGLWDELWRRRWVALSLVAVGTHMAVRVARNLATPAFGWDDFTYHLFRAGRWVQNAGLELEPAPDAWTYYEFFPWGGDLLWAWSLVWQVTDVLVPVTAIVVWSAVLLTAYALARELGQDRVTALIVAVALAVLPSQAGQMSTAYVDNAVLAMVLAASLFILILMRDRVRRGSEEAQAALSGPACFLLGASCGLGLMVKMSFLPLLAPAAMMILWRALRLRGGLEPIAFVGGVSVALPNLAFNWYHRGSPFYPFEITKFLPYNEQQSWILSKYGEGSTAAELMRAGKALVVNIFPLDPFLNVGFLGALLLAFGIAGSVRLARSVRGRWFLVWVLTGGLITVLSFFSPGNTSMVVFWTIVMGRFLVPSLAGLLVSSGLVGPILVRWVILPLLVVEYFLYARRGWPPEITLATSQTGALLAAVALAALLLSRWKGRPGPLWLPLGVALGITLLAVIGVRERTRYDAYRLFAERRLLDFHGAPFVEAWPIWKRVEEEGAGRIAATAGFDGLTGHNWFRAPLLGAWLQNDVVYLPVTRNGEIVSYLDAEKLSAVADRRAWLARLQQREVDRVVALGPATIEHRWILELPQVFAIEISMGRHHFLLARVQRAGLAKHLSRMD